MKKCGTCFRYCEDWRDAEAKGLDNICYTDFYHVGFGDYYRKPRSGVKPHAIGFGCPGDEKIRYDHPACKWHEYRWVWNIKTWWRWHFCQWVIATYRKLIRVPLGRLRKPVPLKWTNYFDGMTDRIIPNGEPVCPHCREMPYSYKQCVFCGQRFTPAESEENK